MTTSTDLNRLKITSTHPQAAGPKIQEQVYNHTVDKIVKSIPGLSSKQQYDLKTKGRIEFQEGACTVVIEVGPAGEAPRIITGGKNAP